MQCFQCPEPESKEIKNALQRSSKTWTDVELGQTPSYS